MELGCFFAAVVAAFEDVEVLLFAPLGFCCAEIFAGCSEGWGFGFICMMVRDRVGGGGREKAGLDADCDCL